ncbi:MAG: S1 RNA-binding domain-containing protein [Acutalibacteraceae bacterium]
MQLEVGMIIEGKVTGITKFGAFVDLPDGKTGMVHISEVALTYVKEIKDHLQEGQTVKAKILSIGDDGKISLSIKKALEQTAKSNKQQDRTPRHKTSSRPGDYEWQPQRRSNEPVSFEDMMSRFKQASDEKMSDLKKFNDTKRGTSRSRGNNQRERG